MKPSINIYLLMICAASILLWGCRPDTPKAQSRHMNRSIQWLTQLTSLDESDRFEAQAPMMNRLAAVTRQELEEVLTSLGKKNVSTLIYVCIKTQNRMLYDVSPPTRMVLETADGAYPNIAYYYARVDPSRGIDALLRLYRRHPAQQLPICLAIGEIAQPRARDFLLAEARRIKTARGSIIAHLHGLKTPSAPMETSDLFWMLDQNLDREEIIGLSELNVGLSNGQLQSLWRSGMAKRDYAVQRILSDPEAYFDALCWIIQRYLESEDTERVKQILMSDSMRLTASQRVVNYRESTLASIRRGTATAP